MVKDGSDLRRFPPIAVVPSVKRMVMKPPRVVFFDDNVRGIGGHYFELMSVLASEANAQGWRPVAVTHRDLPLDQRPDGCAEVHRIFRTHRLLDASLGVDGSSRTPRDEDGRPTERERWSPAWLHRGFMRRQRRPKTMFETYRRDVCQALIELDLGPNDRCVFQTSDDFSLLALLAGLRDFSDRLASRQRANASNRVDVIVHFALVDRSTRRPGKVLRAIGRQLTPPILRRGVDLRIHATTPALCQQWKQTGVPATIREIPYPIRQPTDSSISMVDRHGATSAPHVVMAGMPRAEKGRRCMKPLLRGLESDFQAGALRLSMQASKRVARRMFPRTLRPIAPVHRSATLSELLNTPWKGVRFFDGHLPTEEYSRWLSSADLAIFLYEPDRYEARASGVLIEMMSRGVPVIVPDRCHLSEVVRKRIADPDHRLIYRDHDRLIDAVRQFVSNRQTFAAAADRAAAGVRMAYHARNVFERLQLHTNVEPLGTKAASAA